MTYELAKQLKDAGFPNLTWMDYLTPVGIRTFEKVKQGPTLSGLIEAIGFEDWFDLHFSSEVEGDEKWQADCDLYKWHVEMFGKTPEEAVAKLYLALHTSSILKP